MVCIAYEKYCENFIQVNLDPVNYYSVKCTLVQALRLCTGRTAHKGSRGIALHFHDHSTRKWVRGQHYASAAVNYYRGNKFVLRFYSIETKTVKITADFGDPVAAKRVDLTYRNMKGNYYR